MANEADALDTNAELQALAFERWRLEIHRAILDIARSAYRDESAEMIEMFNAHANYDPKCAAHLWLKALLAKAP